MVAVVSLSCGGGTTPQDDSALGAESGQEAQASATETESSQEAQTSATEAEPSAIETEYAREAEPSAIETESTQGGRQSALDTAAGEEEGSTLPEIEPPRSKPRAGRIAYAHLDGRIITVRSDGSDPVTISPDGGYFSWPTWSPDGSLLVFSGSESGNDAFAPLAMYAYDFAKNEGLHIYANEPDMGPILRNMPHYPMWAPDGKSLAFMASAPEGLTLFVTEPQSDANERMVLVSAPLYASWSADSRRLVVHGGVDLFLVDVAEETVEDLNVRAISYRVPAFRPSGDGVVYVSEDQLGEVSLFMSDSNQGTKTLLDTPPGELAFLWSPNGESLAVAHSRPPGGTFYGGLSIHSPDGVKQQTRIDEELLAFFWSPDSTKLAYVTVSLVQESLRWMVLDVGSGSSWPLTDFLPSSAQLTIFRFFDQFAYSHGPWSPDSSALVFSGNLSGGAVSASMNLQSQAQVIVTDAGRVPSSQAIADGFLGVWSP